MNEKLDWSMATSLMNIISTLMAVLKTCYSKPFDMSSQITFPYYPISSDPNQTPEWANRGPIGPNMLSVFVGSFLYILRFFMVFSRFIFFLNG